jgi:hypothetical protein
MGANAKIRALDAAVSAIGGKANDADTAARAALTYLRVLVAHLGLEVVSEPAGEGKMRIRYRRRVPRWLAWVRKLGACR